MKICRFDDNRLGIVDGSVVRDVSPALELLPSIRWPVPPGDPLISALAALTPRIAELLPTAPELALDSVALHSPVTSPTKLIGAPVNYQAHLAESEGDLAIKHSHNIKPIAEWGLFLKASSALVGPADGIAQRFLDERTDHEIELAVVIGRIGNNVAEADALNYVAGYAVGLDITLRGPQFQSFRKSMDSYAVLGPWLTTADEIDDPGQLDLDLSVNGQKRQASNTNQLILGVPQLIAFASSFYTLYPGDIIYTGSPDGVGPIRPGDLIHASIAKVGSMEITVRAA